MTSIVNRIRQEAGVAVAGASFAVVLVIYVVGALLLASLLPRPTSDPGVLLPGAALVGLTITGLQAVSQLYLPDRFNRASQLYGAIGATVVTLGWFFFAGRAMVLANALNAAVYERFGSITSFVFGLPVLRALPRRWAWMRRHFDLPEPESPPQAGPRCVGHPLLPAAGATCLDGGMGQAIGDLLPSAVGVALSPVPIIAVILMLGTPRARTTGLAFAVGWIMGLIIVSVIVVLLANGADDADSGTSTVVDVLKLVFGALFLLLALKQWRSRPQPGAEPSMPAWMATIDSFSAPKSLLLGAALSGVNPKNLALTLAAAASIAQAGLDGGGTAVAIAVFVVIGSLTVAGPVLFFVAAPRRAAGPLAAIKDFMAAHNAVIMMVVLLVLGAKLIGNGIAGLTD